MKRLGLLLTLFGMPLLAHAQDVASNVNSRYTVERVEIAGIDEARISQKLRDELQALIGGHLDPSEADRLSRRLEAEVPGYEVTHRIARGTESGRIRVVFDFTTSARNWITVMSPRSKLIYHEDQGGSAVFDIAAGSRNQQFSVGFVRGNADDLVEEYSGYRLRAEHTKAVTKRLGLSFEFSKFTQEWKPSTLSALQSNPHIPEPYLTRRTIQPAVTFAFSPHVRFTGGASVSTLDPLSEAGESQHANAGVAMLGYDQTWRMGEETRQSLSASYQLRAGTTALGSDLVYKRHFGLARYFYRRNNSTLRAELLLGAVTGRAPLFERFTLGDSSTLRGWNKYDIVPAGAGRMLHQSIEYAYRHFAYFFDTGSAWERGAGAKVRLSTGVGYHGDFAFATLAVPLNADDTGVKFMMGIRSVSFGFGRR